MATGRLERVPDQLGCEFTLAFPEQALILFFSLSREFTSLVRSLSICR